MREKVWICHIGLTGYETCKIMVTVVAAGVLENNDRYRIGLDVKVNSRLFLVFRSALCCHPFDSTFTQMLLMGYEVI